MRDAVASLKTIVNVSMWGNAKDMKYVGTECAGIANLRYQTKGERELVIIPYGTLVRKMERSQHKSVKSGLSIGAVQDFAFNITEEDLEDIGAAGECVWRGVLKAEGLTFVPAGAIILERTFNGEDSCQGLRFSSVIPSLPSEVDLKLMHTHTLALGRESAYLTLWQVILDTLAWKMDAIVAKFAKGPASSLQGKSEDA
jgi:hypothetical protein